MATRRSARRRTTTANRNSRSMFSQSQVRLDEQAQPERRAHRAEGDGVGDGIKDGRYAAPLYCLGGQALGVRPSSPAITWTLMLPDRRTRSWTTEPCRISNHRDRSTLPMMIWVTLLARA